MTGLRSRNKGANGEREACWIFRNYGFECRRANSQSRNGAEEPDVVGVEIAGLRIHVEVKRGKVCRPIEALNQATRDIEKSGLDIPLALTRCDSGPWHVTLTFEDLMRLLLAKRVQEVTGEVTTAVERTDVGSQLQNGVGRD